MLWLLFEEDNEDDDGDGGDGDCGCCGLVGTGQRPTYRIYYGSTWLLPSRQLVSFPPPVNLVRARKQDFPLTL